MTISRLHIRLRCFCLGWAMAVFLLACPSAFGQAYSAWSDDAWRAPLLPNDLQWRTAGPSSSERIFRVRPFGTPAGCTSDILQQCDNELDAPGADPASRAGNNADDFLDTHVELALAADNPFFDIRLPGAFGGVGYQRLFTEVQVLDTGSSGLFLSCHAVTPAGREFDGLPDGPTYVNPSLSWFQDLGDGSAIQGFVGKTMRAHLHDVDTVPRNLQYGLVLQHPLSAFDADQGPGPRVFLFVETLGRYRLDDNSASPQALNQWNVLPGIHLQTGDHSWLSGGVIVPIGPSRTEPGLWQVTCSWQF
jgi:hypothetical protein